MSQTIPSIDAGERVPPPAWALWERYLLDMNSRLAVRFVERYARRDGTLVWRDEWPGMDGSDDAYESFFNYPLLYALGGDPAVDEIARFEWDAITRQFTGYGQVWREFDGYYDWMHHGESSLYFYFFGLSDPHDPIMRSRAIRFARMYTGDDPEAPNYDPDKNIVVSPINGSRGPRFVNSAEDWVTHRPVLTVYPPPFDDIPGITGPTADWNNNKTFAKILDFLNRRMMRGDVPLNLTATSLVANAFLYSGDTRFRDWVARYTQGWMERAKVNGGLMPDNVGPGGIIGECMNGKWWGGYYGWRWPHGFPTLIEPATIAAENAYLVTGDESFLALPREQLLEMERRGRREDGNLLIPYRHCDGGWCSFRQPDPTLPIHLWYLSQKPEDAALLESWFDTDTWGNILPHVGKGDGSHQNCWYHYIRGRNPGYPEAICRANYAESCRRWAVVESDDSDLQTVDVHHWQSRNPVVIESLVHLMLGSPYIIYHGGLLHTRLRYFDGETRRPGVPRDVAALVSRLDADGVDVELINLSPDRERQTILQAGNFREHRFTRAVADTSPAGEIAVNGPYLAVNLLPGCGVKLRLDIDRYACVPTYRLPWDQ
ncbi:MAG: hypothetical protein IT210_04400 [Armatimonadetes bacterium]|nr:hypothetical protein [Armatimonadota bacterium]